MLKVIALQVGAPRCDAVAEFAEHCSWVAGPRLAQKMRAFDFKPWERVFIAEEDGLIAGFCTLTEKDCIPKVDYAPFIGFVECDQKPDLWGDMEQILKLSLVPAQLAA